VLAHYRLENRGTAPRDMLLFLALRPFQVVPPWQSLNMTAGVSPIREIGFDAGLVKVNRDRWVIPLNPPEHFGAAAFQEGAPIDFLLEGRLPPHEHVVDEFGYASGALQYRFRIEPGATAEAYLAVPFYGADASLQAQLNGLDAGAFFTSALDAATREWARRLDRVVIELPPDEAHIARTLKSTLRISSSTATGGIAARLAQLRAFMDSRRRLLFDCAAGHGLHRGGARVHSVVRFVSRAQRSRAVLRRSPRRRSGARARQPGRAHLHGQ
jgi:hypothetical protein